MGAGCSTASVFIQMDEIVAIARSNRIEEALLKEEVVNFILQNNYIDQFLAKAVLYYTKVRRRNIRKSIVKVKIRTLLNKCRKLLRSKWTKLDPNFSALNQMSLHFFSNRLYLYQNYYIPGGLDFFDSWKWEVI